MSTRLPPVLRVFLQVNLGLTAACFSVEFICVCLGFPALYDQPFFVGPMFSDFDIFKQSFAYLHRAAFFSGNQSFAFNYPAPAAVVYAIFYRAGPACSLGFFLGFIFLCLAVVLVLYARSLHQGQLSGSTSALLVITIAALAFPFWFGFERANIEAIVCIISALGVRAFVAKRGYAAAACFGLASSIKIIPILYLGLLLARRKYKQFFVGLFVSALATIVSLQFIGPDLLSAWRGIAAGMERFHQQYVLGKQFGADGWDHSLLGAYRHIVSPTQAEYEVYLAVTAMAGIFLFLRYIVKLPFVNQVLCLSTAIVWLAPVSFEYTLMNLYSAFVLFSLAVFRMDEKACRKTTPFFVLLAILFSPLSEFIWHGHQLGGLVKSFVLGGTFVLSMLRPITTQYDDELARRGQETRPTTKKRLATA